MKQLCLLLALCPILLAGCGGSGGGGKSSPSGGVSFDAISPDVAVRGRELDLYVRLSPVSTEEALQTTTATATATGGITIDDATWTATLPEYRSYVGHVVHIALPATAVVGAQYKITIKRSVATADGGAVEASKTITVTDRDVEATLSPNSASAPSGSAITATVSMLPIGNASGTVEFDSNALYAVTPSTITLTAGQTVPSTATVTITLPAELSPNPLDIPPLDIPVSWTFAGRHKFVPFRTTQTTTE